MDNNLGQIIDSSAKILILVPLKANLDTMSAALSLRLSLVLLNKQVVVASSTPVLAQHARLVGVDKVVDKLSFKSNALEVSIPDYNPDFIDNFEYDLDGGFFKFRLFLKEGHNLPSLDKVKTNYKSDTFDLTILVGGKSDLDFEHLFVDGLETKRIIHISSLSPITIEKIKQEILAFVRPSFCLSEMVGRLLVDHKYPVDEDVATNLILGIEDATNNLSDPKLSADVLEIFAVLLRSGGKRSITLNPKSFPGGAIPDKPYVAGQTVAALDNSKDNVPQADKDQEKGQGGDLSSDEDIPQSWFEPKIYTGTSIS